VAFETPVIMVAVPTNGDPVDAGRSAGEQCGLPATQSVFIKGQIKCRCGITDDIHQTIDMAVGRS
jgi:hypothetical protein